MLSERLSCLYKVRVTSVFQALINAHRPLDRDWSDNVLKWINHPQIRLDTTYWFQADKSRASLSASALCHHFGELGPRSASVGVAEGGVSAPTCASKTSPHEMQRRVRYATPGRSSMVLCTVDRARQRGQRGLPLMFVPSLAIHLCPYAERLRLKRFPIIMSSNAPRPRAPAECSYVRTACGSAHKPRRGYEGRRPLRNEIA
jgi:hypothetical protein